MAVLLVLAGLIRAVGLGDRPLWLDEAFSLLYARIDLHTLIELRHRGTNPPLYHLILSWWASLFGASDVALRSLSVLAGVGSVAATYALGRSMAGRGVGAIASGMLTINSMATGYSQEARYYALIELLAIGGALLLRQLVVSRRRRWVIGYTVLMSVFVWTHTFAWFVLAAHVVAVVGYTAFGSGSSRARRAVDIRFGITVAIVCASFMPWAGVLGAQVETVLTRYWIPEPEAWMIPATLHGFIAPLVETRWWFVVLCLVLVIALAGRSFRQRPSQSPRDMERGSINIFDVLLLSSWAFLPIIIPLVWSCVSTPIFQVKYTLAAQPAWLLLLALLIRRRPAVGLAIVAFGAAVHAPAPHRGLQLEDWRTAAAIVDENVEPGTPVYICQDYTYYALAAYLDEETYQITPVIKQGSVASEFAEIYPQPPLEYDDWLRQLQTNVDVAAVVLSRLHSGPNETEFRKVIDDLAAIGYVRPFDVEGDVDVVLWRRVDPPAEQDQASD